MKNPAPKSSDSRPGMQDSQREAVAPEIEHRIRRLASDDSAALWNVRSRSGFLGALLELMDLDTQNH